MDLVALKYKAVQIMWHFYLMNLVAESVLLPKKMFILLPRRYLDMHPISIHIGLRQGDRFYDVKHSFKIGNFLLWNMKILPTSVPVCMCCMRACVCVNQTSDVANKVNIAKHEKLLAVTMICNHAWWNISRWYIVSIILN